MSDLKDRLKEARKLANKTQAQVADAVGMKQPSYQQLESGKANASTFLPLIANFLSVDALWLQTGAVRVKEDSAKYNLANVVPVSENLSEKRQDVPLLTWVSAGSWLQNYGSFSAKDAERWLPCPVPHSIMTFALKVSGDSMTSPYPNEKSYPHGTLIYVDPQREVVNRCSVVAFLPKEQAYTFKRYVEDSGRCYLKPLNPTYDTIAMTDDILICGVVIGAFFDE